MGLENALFKLFRYIVVGEVAEDPLSGLSVDVETQALHPALVKVSPIDVAIMELAPAKAMQKPFL